MKILVLNGSPKAENSVTLQHMYYVQKQFSEHVFKVLNIVRDIPKIEIGNQLFTNIIEEIKDADLIVWAFPVYGLVVPADYKKFIELVWQSDMHNCFKDKYTCALTTSIHFLNNYARYYIHANCDDLEMKYVGCFQADAHTLLKAESREALTVFFAEAFRQAENRCETFTTYLPIRTEPFAYRFRENEAKISTDKKVIILAGTDSEAANLNQMIARFQSCFEHPVEVIELKKAVKKGCIGCLQCCLKGTCIYDKVDSFAEIFFTKVRNADIIIFADRIHDRYLSSDIKRFLDRCFVINHQPRVLGKQVGFIIAGGLLQMPILRNTFEAWVEANKGNVVGFASDDSHDGEIIDAQLFHLAQKAVRFSENNVQLPRSFEGTAALKIYRDEIWGELRPVFISDHRYFKKNGYYDFPQNNFGLRLYIATMGFLNKIPGFRKWLLKKISSIRLKPYQNVINKS